jgi:hypothetical protein
MRQWGCLVAHMRATVVVSTVKEEPLMPPAPSEEEMPDADADAHSRA